MCKVLGRVPVSTTEVLEFLLYIANIISQLVGCLSVSFAVQKLLNVSRFHLLIFVFTSIILEDRLIKDTAVICQRVLC